MRFIRYIRIYLNIFRRSYIPGAICIYLILGYLRWQPWTENSMKILWYETFSWDSFSITLLPAVLILLHKFINWLHQPLSALKSDTKENYCRCMAVGIMISSAIVAVVYIAVIAVFSPGFSFNLENNLQMLMYLFTMYLLLNMYCVVYCIGKVKNKKTQSIVLFLLAFPAIDYACYFYGGIRLIHTRIFLDNGSHAGGLAFWGNIVFFLVFLVLLFFLLRDAVLHMELTGEYGHERI